MLKEEMILGSIQVTEAGHVQVREDTYVTKEGRRIHGPSYHRYVLSPGDDVRNQDARVRAVCKAVWTKDVIADYQAAMAAMNEHGDSE